MWVFGIVDSSQTPALGYMEVVQSRDAATLLPTIQAHVAPGSVVHSDQWRAYSRVSRLPTINTHHTVNHSLNFVDPVTGVHTQHVESHWNRVKLKLKAMKGCHAHQVPSYLDEFMWRERYATTGKRAVHAIMQDIANHPKPVSPVNSPLLIFLDSIFLFCVVIIIIMYQSHL